MLVGFRCGRRRILAHIDIGDVELFHLLYHCPDKRDRQGIDACLNIRVDPLGVSELRSWVSLSLLE